MTARKALQPPKDTRPYPPLPKERDEGAQRNTDARKRVTREHVEKHKEVHARKVPGMSESVM